MSLDSAVLAIAGLMEAAGEKLLAKDDAGEFVKGYLDRYAEQLRIAVTASEGARADTNSALRGLAEPPEIQHFRAVEAAKAEFRGRAQAGSPDDTRAVDNVEDVMGRVALCVGGPEDGTTVPISPAMPLGARVMVGVTVYELSGRRELVPLNEAPPKFVVS